MSADGQGQRRVQVTLTEETRVELRAIARVARALAFEGETMPTAEEHVAAMGNISDLAAALADGPIEVALDWRKV